MEVLYWVFLVFIGKIILGKMTKSLTIAVVANTLIFNMVWEDK